MILASHDCSDKAEDCVELRKCGVDQGIGENIVSLRNTDDTVGADLSLADSGDHTSETHGNADAKYKGAADRSGSEFAEHNEEGYETVDTLGCGKSGKDHVTS